MKNKRLFGNFFWIFLCLLVGFFFRIFIIDWFYHTDLLSIAGWGEWIYKNGYRDFYYNGVWTYSWPTQLPFANMLYGFTYSFYQQLVAWFSNIAFFIATYRLAPSHLLWWFDFVKWFGTAYYKDTHFPTGFLVSIKLFAVFADIIIAFLIYQITKKIGRKTALFYTLAFLFLPFTWYLSALWGQYDQLSFLLLFVSFLFLMKKNFIIAPAILFVSIGIKPTSAIFLPLFFYLIFLFKPKISHLAAGLVIGSAILIIPLFLFSNTRIQSFIDSVLIPKVINKSEFRVSVNAYNFWHLLVGFKQMGQDTLFIFIPAKLWGYLAYVLLNIYAWFIIKAGEKKNVMAALFIIGTGSWLFLTNMLERYLFSGVVFGLLTCVYYKGLFKYWLVLSLLFWINLYRDFLFPESISLMNTVITWQGSLVGRLIAFTNLAVFFKMVVEITQREGISKKMFSRIGKNLILARLHIKIK